MRDSTRQKTVLVTGASRGIGFAIAQRFAEQGLRIIVHARLEQQAEEAAERLCKAGAQARSWACDLKEMGSSLPEEVDVLVHNAACFAPFSPITKTAPEDVEAVLAVCLHSGILLARAALPSMYDRGFGRLIFIGSAAAHLGAGGQVAYATAKAGLVGLTRSLALEAGRHGVTCNLVEPGLIDTERTRSAVCASTRAGIEARSAIGRSGQTKDVAALVNFLASEEAAYITGAVIPVDGGLGLGAAPIVKNKEVAR